MDTSLIVTLAVLAVVIAVSLLRSRMTKGAAIGSLLPTPKPPEGRSLYDISSALTGIYHRCAHPEDFAATPDFREGVTLLSSPRYSAADLADYFCGENAIIAMMAAVALAEREDSQPARDRIVTYIGTVAPWPVHFALRYLARRMPASEPVVGTVLARMSGYLYDRQAKISLGAFVEERVRAGEVPTFDEPGNPLNEGMLTPLWDFIGGLEPAAAEPVRRALQAWSDSHIDRGFLQSFGTIWDAERIGTPEKIVDHPALASAAERAVDALAGTPARSVVLVGEPGTGKATLARRIAQMLAAEGWTIFQAGHAQLIAGQSYIGQIEERLRQLLTQLGGQRRILWIVPGFHELAYSGRHQYAPVSALDTLLGPAQRGDIKILGLTLPGTYERLARQMPGIETGLMTVKLEPAMPEEARALVTAWLGRIGIEPAEAERLTGEASELAQQFLTSEAAPGNLFNLVKRTFARAIADPDRGERDVGVDDLVETLAEITGLPIGLLDERLRIDIEDLRRRFNARVLGQPEAVDCLVERVAMMKAGLADPRRPVGVFLFAGPTGTGKTEMAKTLAEWLFGSAERLVRVDMSELQTPDDTERLLGKGGSSRADVLASRIREQPFSVVLLDEFEKAHPRVWDLFLQVFDDGRLTDRAGHTADFRHAIIILTSNLGSTIPTGVSLGFRGGDESFDPGSVLRAVEQSFRREFVNRLDRVIVFRPLTRELMRAILEKELGDVLKRRGLRTKPWAVEWEPAAIDFLLEQGFTPDLGARPLRRAVERYFLSPLALTMVNHQTPEGDQFLFVSRDGARLDVRFVDPDATGEAVSATSPAGATPAADAVPSLRVIALEPAGSRAEVAYLGERYRALADTLEGEDWRRARDDDIAAMQEAGFWRSEVRWAALDRIERHDRIGHAMRRAGSLLGRLERASVPPRDLVQTLGQSLYLIDIAVEDVVKVRPSDAFIMVAAGNAEEAVRPAAEAFAAELAEMYRAWARRRRMELVETRPPTGASGEAPFRFLAAVRGFGACSILAGEHGLHVFETGSRGAKGGGRLTAAVRVVPEHAEAPAETAPSLARRAERAVADAEDGALRIVRRYRKAPSPLVRDSVKGWRTGRIDQVLGGDFDLVG